MPVSTDIDLDKVEKEQGGKGLRAILEEALKENREAYGKLATYEARDAIGEHGWTLVKPEDLVGVDGDLVEAGKKLQEERENQREETLRSVLAERGLEGEDLDKALGDLLTPAEGSKRQDDWGDDLPRGDDFKIEAVDPDNMTGVDWLIQAEAETARKRRR